MKKNVLDEERKKKSDSVLHVGIEGRLGVHVCHETRLHRQSVGGCKIVVKLVVGYFCKKEKKRNLTHSFDSKHSTIGKLDANKLGREVGPQVDCLGGRRQAAAEDEEGQVHVFYKLDAAGVALEGDVERVNAFAGEDGWAGEEDDCVGLELVLGLLDNLLEDVLVHLIVDAVAQRHVDRVVLALAVADVLKGQTEF